MVLDMAEQFHAFLSGEKRDVTANTDSLNNEDKAESEEDMPPFDASDDI
jgi:hypothetical protein